MLFYSYSSSTWRYEYATWWKGHRWKSMVSHMRTERSCESCRELLGVFTVILPFVGKVREGDCNGNKNILIFIFIFIPPKTKDFRFRNQAFHWWIEIINVKKNDKTWICHNKKEFIHILLVSYTLNTLLARN